MDPNQRPHSRDKKVAEGTANVGKGEQVAAGGPVGGQDHRPGAQSQPGQQQKREGVTRRSGSLLPLLLLVVVAFFLLRTCSGSGAGMSGSTGTVPTGPSIEIQETQPEESNTFMTEETYVAPEPAQEEPVVTTVADTARDKRVVLKGGGKDTVTIMVYMCGTDLESKHSMGTADMKEMLNASMSDKVNLIICTGGCKQWKNNVVSNAVNQIYQIDNGKLYRLEENFGTKAMTDPTNLTSFIQYCTKNFPADRNALILWDHGGGSVAGYGYDEKTRSAASMDLTKLNSALKNAGCVFEWIGFDACLMATLETALVCNDYADYLVASEETEPGTGWYYTNWLTKLSKNTSTPMVDLGKTIVDDFVGASTRASSNTQVTLSVIDLAELQGTIPQSFKDFATSTHRLLKSDNYQQVSDARANVRQFSVRSRINQIDLVDFANRIGTNESKALAEALKGCVKYNGSNISRAYGVSIFFPYESLQSVNSAVAVYQDLGLSDEYTDCIRSFASMESAGQISANSTYGGGDLFSSLLGGGSSPNIGSLFGSSSGGSSGSYGGGLDASTILQLLGAFGGRSMPQELSWMDQDVVEESAQYVADHHIDPSRITVTDRNGTKVLALSDEEWKLIQTVELNIFADDGEGYIDLGRDNTFDWTDNGELLLEFDGTWLTIDGHACAYYLESDTENDDGTWTTVGRIPAKLNDELVNLEVVFDAEHPDGSITGAYPFYNEGETETQAKGGIPLQPGDTVQLLCDYYSYDNEYDAAYTLGDSFTVGDNAPVIANMKLSGIDRCSACWRLTDIYGNHYWTPAIDY